MRRAAVFAAAERAADGRYFLLLVKEPCAGPAADEAQG
jgi:hypothetical protein